MKNKTKLSNYDNSWYSPGKGPIIRLVWYFVNSIFLNSYIFPINKFKVLLLKLFGAKIGKGCVIKPNVNVKYPWKLKLGDYVWLGENVWIDNLDHVEIGSNACLSQGAMLLCGNHNYKLETFDLMTKRITLEEGSWVGAKSVVGPGVTMRSHAVLSVMSFANKDLEAYGIYSGVPAKFAKKREIGK